MVFPVRYVAGGRLLETLSSELGDLGVSLLAATPPAPGTIIGMQLFLPGGTAPCAATGLVIQAREHGGVRSFWAEFTGLTRGADEIIAALLHAGQRTSRRPAVNFKVSCRVGERMIYETVENVGTGGIFVRARAPAPVDSVIDAHLEIPDGKPPAKVRARVAHASLRGFGLQFLEGEDGFRERVESLVGKLCA